jgi:hypothetical protein
MLLKQLSLDDKRDFLCIAELLSLADKPLLLGDKFRIRSVARTNFGTKLSIERSDAELAAMDELAWKCDSSDDAILDYASGNRFGRMDIEPALLKRFDKLPQDHTEEPAARATVTLDVLREVLKGRKAEMPSVPKVMLFELMLLALAKGSISSIEWQLLNEFMHHHQLEKHVFDDLLERAECAHREAQKTLAIILE